VPGNQQNAEMQDKQETGNIMTPVNILNTGLLYDSSVTLAQYNIFNLFRILRPIRIRYKLSVNDILILVAGVLYHKHIGSIYSISALRRFLGYFNDKKFGYYHNRLIESGYIIQSDFINGSPRYRLTDKSIEVVSRIDECYNRSLLKFINDYSLKE
jgi:hypothetical protein